MSAEERERDLLTAVALLQATLSAKELKIEALESEVKALRTVDHDADRRLQMLEIALEDARNAYENLKGIFEMNQEMHTADRESWWRDRDSLIERAGPGTGAEPLRASGAEPTPGQRKAGPDEDDGGGGGQAGDGLAEPAGGFPGVYGTNPSAEATGQGEVCEALGSE